MFLVEVLGEIDLKDNRSSTILEVKNTLVIINIRATLLLSLHVSLTGGRS